MRLRITLALVAILAVALFLAGTASLILVRRAASNNARVTVLHQTESLVRATHSIKPADSGDSAAAYDQLLALVRAIAGIKNPAIVFINSSGSLVGAPPTGLSKALFSGANGLALAKGKSISGSANGVAYAAAPLVRSSLAGVYTVVLVLQSPITDSSSSVSYFLLAGAISLFVAGAMAILVTSHISRRVIASARAAGVIATGDFATRVDTQRRDYPELIDLAESINTMAQDLERAQTARRQFLLSISHDLRTPLTSIRGYAEAIHDRATPDPARASQVIVAEADRLQRLIGDLLDLARLEGGHFALHPVPVEFNRVVRQSVEALRYAFESSGIELHLNVATEPLEGLADADRVAQIVANLLENALKFARSRVEVHIGPSGEDPGLIVLEVHDDGPGIAPEDLPHIFERLYTSGRLEARSAGTGIGLAIVAELIEAMGGLSQVESPLGPNGGTRFSILMPRAHSVGDDRAKSPA